MATLLRELHKTHSKKFFNVRSSSHEFRLGTTALRVETIEQKSENQLINYEDMMKIKTLLLSGFIAFSSVLSATTSPFLTKLHDEVLSTFSSENKEADDGTLYLPLREKINAAWPLLEERGVFRVISPDSATRPYLIALQSLVENFITRELGNELKSSIAIIHTPQPSTPLCQELRYCILWLDPLLQRDPLRRYTSEERINGLRSYLYHGGTLYSVYPQQGFDTRSPSEQKNYLDVVAEFPNLLIDWPLKNVEMDRSQTGATYILTDKEDKTIVFSVQLTQANHPMKPGIFKVWLGSLDNPKVNKRVNSVLKFVNDASNKPFPVVINE